MSVFDAFEEKEKQPDQGWGHSSRFSNSNSISPTENIQSNSNSNQTLIVETPEIVVESSPEKACSTGTRQPCASRVTDSQVSEPGVRTVGQQSQESDEGEVQIVSNGFEAVSPSLSSVQPVPGRKQQSLKLQTSVTETGQVLFSITGNFKKEEEKALLQQLLSKVNYQQLANKANLQTECPVSVNKQPAPTPSQLSQVSSTNSISTSQTQAQLPSQIRVSSTTASTASASNSLNNILSQARISKEDLLKLIKSKSAGVFTRPPNPQQLQGQKIVQIQQTPTPGAVQVLQAPNPATKTQQAIIPVILPGTAQKIPPNQNVTASSLVDLIQRGNNQCSVGSETTTNLVLNPQQTLDNFVKVVQVAPSTPVKQATAVPNNQIISNLTLTSPQKAQPTVVGSPQTVTSGNQTIVIPSSGTQYIIVNSGTPVQTSNSPGTQPVRIIQTGQSPQASQVQALLASPQFAASQTPARIVLTQGLSPVTSIVDNSSPTSSPGRGRPVSNATPRPVGRGIVNGRVRSRGANATRGNKTARQNYFVNPLSVQNRPPTGGVFVRPKNCIVKAGNTSVRNSQHLVKAMSQESMTIIQTEVRQQLNGANTNTQQAANNSSQENSSSSSSQGNASLVEYSDSDSSEKDSEAVEPSTPQGAPGIKFANGVVPIPNPLSDAIAKAKPNQKIQVDRSLKFVRDVVYKFPLKEGIKFYRYDGEFLVPNPDAEGMAGGGVGERKEKALRGNATGMHMTTPQTNRKFLKAAEAVGTKVFKGGRFWTHSGGPQRSARATSSSNGEVQSESEESSSLESNQGRKRPIEDVSDLPPIKDDEIRLVHCKFCGFASYTVKSCERCHRTFPSDTKIEIDKKRFKQDDETSTSAIPKQTFYGKPTCSKMTVLIHTAQATRSDGSVVNVNYVSHGRRVNLEGKSYRSPSVIRGGRQPRKSYTSEPVTISISSDEEEEPEKPTVPGSTATGSITTTTGSVTTVAGSVATATGNVTTATRSVTPAAKQQNIPTSKGSDPTTADKDDIGQLLDSIPQTKRSTSPVLQGSRMVKMEDEEGKPILVRKSMRRKSPTQPASSSASAPARCTSPQPTASTGDISSVNFIADVVRIGSVPAVAIEPILVAEDSISFYLEFEETAEKFFIKPDELQQCMFCLENRPVIFLKTTVEFARKVRELLKLESKEGGLWFDPDDTALKHQFITFAMKGLGSLTYVKLNSILQKYPKPEGQSFPYIVKMTGEQALVYMKEVLEGEGENGGQVDSSTPQPHLQLQPPSPTSVKILFTGPVVKLITFPPPPAPGGIQVTNEDLSCLEEGEFLNDVIIDFYLKYLFLDVLSDRDRQRTHIFSSFFFKRLTQRQGRCGLEADMVDKTPAEKKHARVKNWTKKVDLFEKDFIFVPINEHSHWFLAVICFPGLQAPAQFSYIPKLTKPVTQKTLIAQIVSTLAAKSTGTGPPIKSGETGKEPVNSLKGYKIPKVAKSGEEAQSESESNNSEGKSVNNEENEKDNGERPDEPMETEEKDLSEAQKREIEEDSEEVMDTSESPSQTTSEDGDNDKEKSQPQSDNSSQEIVKSETESEEKTESESGEKTESESQEKTECESQEKTENQTKEVLEKPMKIHFRTPAKDIRGRELTAEELKDPDILKTCSYGWRQPCILVFDSLAGQNRSRIVAILKEYLQVEWETKKKSAYKEKIRGCTATKVPQQTNFSDCGVYVLQYVESFFEDPIQDFAIPLRPLTNWFTEERVTAKRKEIKDLVMRLKEIQEKAKS